MKRLITVSLILLGMVLTGIASIRYLHRVQTDISALLTEAESVVEADPARAIALCKEASDCWDKAEPILILFLPHSEVDEMAQVIAELSAYVEFDDATITVAAIRRACGIAEHLYTTQLPYLSNIL